jgi:N6-L-threonylcarbamoyladenine synthase
VFAHVKNLPDAFRDARELLSAHPPIAVGVSTRPRNVSGSYMPCFLAGRVAAESIAAASAVKLYEFSHQCGHIMAAIYSSRKYELLSQEFAAFHISGGTTELLRVRGNGLAFDAEKLGGTEDLNAGQIIDRIGVALGLPFPAGPHLEKLFYENKKPVPKKKVSAHGLSFNLSGLENIANKIYFETNDKAFVAAVVFEYIANSIISACREYTLQFGDMPFVFAGGVMSNLYLKERLSSEFNASFAEPALSSDNAVGIAALTLRAHKNNA